MIEPENYYERKEIMNFYREVKKGERKTNHMFYIKDKDGNLIREDKNN